MICTISQVYFDKELYMFRTNLPFIIRSLNTVYTAICIFHTSCVDCLLARQNILTNLTGVIGQARNAATPLETWNCLITVEILDNNMQRKSIYCYYPTYL